MQPETTGSAKFIPFAVKVTDALVDAAEQAGIAFAAKGHEGFDWRGRDRLIKFYSPIFVEANSAFLDAGFFSQGAHSYSRSMLDQRVTVARYCTIGGDVTLAEQGQPLERLSTCGLDYANFLYLPKGFKAVKHLEPPPAVIVGNDVAIGDEVLLARRVTIGHGAVIGARSVVTQDVPPYAIVAGSPAVIRRYRFDERTIARLLKSEWWNVDPSCLSALDTTDVPAFLDAFEALRGEGRLRPYRPRVVALHELFRPAR